MRVLVLLTLAVLGLVRGGNVKRSSWLENSFNENYSGSRQVNIQTARGPTFGGSDGIRGNQINQGSNNGNVRGPQGANREPLGVPAGRFEETARGNGNDQESVLPNRGSEVLGSNARFTEEGGKSSGEPQLPYANYDLHIIHSYGGENYRSRQNGENSRSSNTDRFLGGLGSGNILSREEQENGERTENIRGGDNEEFARGFESSQGDPNIRDQNGGSGDSSNTDRFPGGVASGGIRNREEQMNREITGSIRGENNRESIRADERPRGEPNNPNQNRGNGNTDRFTGEVASGNNREEQRNREVTGSIRGENNREFIGANERPRGEPSIFNQNGRNGNTDRFAGEVASGNNREEQRNREVTGRGENNREFIGANERSRGEPNILNQNGRNGNTDRFAGEVASGNNREEQRNREVTGRGENNREFIGANERPRGEPSIFNQNGRNANTDGFAGGLASGNILNGEEERNREITGRGENNREFIGANERSRGEPNILNQNGRNGNTDRFVGGVASGNNREEQTNREVSGSIRGENNREFIRGNESPRSDSNILNQNGGNANTDRFAGGVASGNILNREEQRNREITGRGENNREFIRGNESPRSDSNIPNQNGGDGNTERLPGGVASGNRLNSEEQRIRDSTANIRSKYNRLFIRGNGRPRGHTNIGNYGRRENIEVPTSFGRETEVRFNSFSTPINTGLLNDNRGFAESGQRNLGRAESALGNGVATSYQSFWSPWRQI